VEQFVLVCPQGPDRFTAHAVAFPECRAEGKTEAEAVEQVRQSLMACLMSGKLVRVDIPVSGTGNPWLDSFGRSADDPTFGAYLEELQKARAGDTGDEPADIPA
jgi:hypothetical protein